ncbi:hypothetical protein C1645_185010 [Glomus cerebriforme]|uniref:Putative restriction endonuclease domain-containing protein n=1 Tax=Glomus cerebriforme TaxID=658196 RepID=A0A397T3M4_9GLOM|nr:hypothetical protein C1645_185010 [Glomus cerebriforme]
MKRQRVQGYFEKEYISRAKYEKRLPLILAKDVKFNKFVTRVEKIKAKRYFDYRNGIVTIIELPTGEHETTHSKFSRQFLSAFNNATPQDDVEDWGAKSLSTNLPTNEYEEPDACFVPKRLLTQNPALILVIEMKSWPTIIFEVASSESLIHLRNKINNYWLVPNRCEDVIVIKIGSWRTRRCNNQIRHPLRRLRVSIILNNL